MFQYEAMNEERGSGSPGYVSGEESLLSSSAGQKLSLDATGQAPTVGQRLVLALVSLGMLMGMTTLLTIRRLRGALPAGRFSLSSSSSPCSRRQWSASMSHLAAEFGEPSLGGAANRQRGEYFRPFLRLPVYPAASRLTEDGEGGLASRGFPLFKISLLHAYISPRSTGKAGSVPHSSQEAS